MKLQNPDDEAVLRSMLRYFRRAGLLILVASLTSSCVLLKLKENVKAMNAHGVVSVTVTPVSKTAPTYALAWRALSGGRREMIGFQRVEPDGLAVFLLVQDKTYNIGAFTDLNTNGQYDGGEPMDYVRNVRPTPLSDTKATLQQVVLTLSPSNGLPVGQSLEIPPENKELGAQLTITIGAIADLDAPQFSAEEGEIGMSQQFDFLLAHGAGVYFLEPYDAKKIPVLFVYGIAGSFQNWREVVTKMDRKKYQPWLFYYPSGLRLDKLANGLASALLILRERYKFDQIDIVAHSMGGLVARGAIQRVAERAGTNFIPEFVTVSTPWGGHEAAAMGVKHLNFPVPAWRDMAPNSDYLKDILSHPLPAGTRHDLIFGFKSTGGIGLPTDNDGVVGVDSELVEEVQSNAASVHGYHLGHDEILMSPLVIKRIEGDLEGK